MQGYLPPQPAGRHEVPGNCGPPGYFNQNCRAPDGRGATQASRPAEALSYAGVLSGGCSRTAGLFPEDNSGLVLGVSPGEFVLSKHYRSMDNGEIWSLIARDSANSLSARDEKKL